MNRKTAYQILEDYIQSHREELLLEAESWWQIGIRLNPSVFPELYEEGFYEKHPKGDIGSMLPRHNTVHFQERGR